jgi:hypothetical protein
VILKLYQKSMGAANSLSGLLAVAKNQNYGRLDAETEDYAISLLVADESNERMLFADLDAVVAGVAALREEVARRRGVVAK